MTAQDLNYYQNKTVRVKYSTKAGPQSRTGFVLTVTTLMLVLLTFPADDKYTKGTGDDECEIHCPISEIDDIKELKPTL